ncbi:TPA: hypothetical protein ACWSJ0_002240 [Klebsiella pneumoniae]|uniref:hypothetical protein n=1 Tax=Klebsiella quasipneumoniae TaxID=1463165 RepID=UPI002366D234|nr:hypothetical protein [Klebsiella quasipneumoniae]HBX4473340.1 hypothetical protein [Klebsiella pneumoniae]MDD7844814.1 hypothetical protein [Klebsiella quasipneumoniae]MDD7858326.1 hypothetical protein [Klebsiella quasipneumoniae]MDF8305992.1 hypothetical protein [Klebsiella quasipneumoniae]HBX4702230.1 hypothetical protein [Klebsiella pneumoniae]
MTDITELAQLRGRTVDYPYYLVECDCGKIYPSSELSGGEPMGDSGDYSDCYCPHCGEGEEHFAECADPETAWKAQQDKIDALVEALEKAQRMESYWKTQCRGITDHCEELQARIAELASRTVKLPAERFCPAEYAGSQLWSETEVWNKAITACADELRASGIKVEAE